MNMDATPFSHHRSHHQESPANPPSLYDTSTSTGAESWSTGSAGHHHQRQSPNRPQQQQQAERGGVYPSHYLPKTRPQYPTRSQSVVSAPTQSYGYNADHHATLTAAAASADWTASTSGYSNYSSGRDHHSSHARHNHHHQMEEPTPNSFASKVSLYSNSPSSRDQFLGRGDDIRLRIDPSAAPPSSPQYNNFNGDYGQTPTTFDQRQEVFEQRASSSSHRPRSTKSEPGAAPNSDHDRFSAYVNRFAVLEQQRRHKIDSLEADSRPPSRGRSSRGFGSRSSDRSTGSSSQISDRIKQYNQRYNDTAPEPQLVPSDEQESSTHERRQAPSSLERPHSRGRDDYKVKVHDRSKHHYSSQRGSSLPPNRRTSSVEVETHNLPDTPSSRNSASDLSGLSRSVPNFHGNIERPSRSSIKDLKRQLWDNSETLQVPVKPTLAHADGDESYNDSVRRKSNYGAHITPESAGKSGLRSSRSLSPERRSISSQDGGDQKFNSKYYEAAIAARLRGKVHPTEVRAPGDRGGNDFDGRRRRDSSRRSGGGRALSVERRSSSNNREPFPNERRSSSARRGVISDEARRRSGREASIERGNYRNNDMSVDRQSSWGYNHPAERRNKVREPSMERASRNRDPAIDRRTRAVSVERGRDSISREERPPRGEQSPAFAHRKSYQKDAPSSTNSALASQEAIAGGKAPKRREGETPPLLRSGSWTVSSVRKKGPNDAQIPWEKRAARDESKQPPFELARHGNGTNISKLVAKLSSVNRQNPADALAEIDSILKAESDSGGGGSAFERARERENKTPSSSDVALQNGNEEEEEDSDDETTVSSITNPTFQSARVGHDQSNSLDPFLHIDTIPTAIAPNPTNPFGQGPLSTAAFRRPRPSNLQSYVAPPPEITPAVEKVLVSQRKNRKSRNRELPPATIKTKTPSPSSSVRASEMPFGQDPLTNPEVSDSNIMMVNDELVEVGHETLSTQEGDPNAIPKDKKSKLDSFMSNSSALAQQIRVWDELSNGVNRSRSMDSEKGQDEDDLPTSKPIEKRSSAPDPVNKSAVVEPPRAANEFDTERKSTAIPILPAPPQHPSARRAHPWDKSMPLRHEKVKAKDTSMDEGDGVEMLIENKNEFTGFEGFDDDLNANKRLSTERVPHFHEVDDNELRGSRLSSKEVNASFGSSQKSPSAAGGWAVTPRITPQQHENAQKISEDFDNAWVSLPADTFFPDIVPSTPPHRSEPREENFERKQTQNPTSQKQGRQSYPQDNNASSRRRGRTGPVDLDDLVSESVNAEAPHQFAEDQVGQSFREFDSMHNSGLPRDYVEPGKIEVSLMENSPGKQNPSKRHSPVRATISHTKFVPTESAEVPPKRRGGFFTRAFGRKDKKKNAAASSTASKDSSTQQSVAPTSNREPPMLPMLPAPQFDQKEIAPPPGRGRRGNRTPTRSRSRSRSSSLERIRSSKMAEKFSRVLRLYDHE